ncbi:MAG: hypothetical protein WB007_07675, partial [Candidatus Acidiferrales bacterium]
MNLTPRAVRHYKYSLPSPVEWEDLVAHFYIYGDESGKLEQSDYVSFCGYVAHASEWERVSMEWNNMRLAWDVPPLHMRCIVAPERDKSGEWIKIKEKWGDVWEIKREAMLSQFGAVIRDATVACIGSVIDAAHFRKMPNSAFKSEMTNNPLFFGFYNLLMEGLDKIDRIDKALSVSVIIDDDEQYAMKCYKLLNTLRNT